MELWQSGNAADSKSAEPVSNRRTGSNPVGSFLGFVNAFKSTFCLYIRQSGTHLSTHKVIELHGNRVKCVPNVYLEKSMDHHTLLYVAVQIN